MISTREPLYKIALNPPLEVLENGNPLEKVLSVGFLISSSPNDNSLTIQRNDGSKRKFTPKGIFFSASAERGVGRLVFHGTGIEVKVVITQVSYL